MNNAFYIILEKWSKKGINERKSVILNISENSDYAVLNAMEKNYPGWIIIFFKKLEGEPINAD